MTEIELRAAAALLSPERLATFVAITGTEQDALELHNQTMEVGAALMPVTGLIEVAIRNEISERLRNLFGVQDWLNNPPPQYAWRGEEIHSLNRAIRQGQRAEYAKLTSADKRALDAIAYPMGIPPGTTHEVRVKARQRAVQVNMGQQIAQLTLYFWKRLFSSDYEPTLWDRSLKRVFPNKSLTRGQIATQLEVIYQTRNRIAHHEPIMGARLQATMQAIDFVLQNFKAPNPGPDAILVKMSIQSRKRLQEEADKLVALLDTFTVS